MEGVEKTGTVETMYYVYIITPNQFSSCVGVVCELAIAMQMLFIAHS